MKVAACPELWLVDDIQYSYHNVPNLPSMQAIFWSLPQILWSALSPELVSARAFFPLLLFLPSPCLPCLRRNHQRRTSFHLPLWWRFWVVMLGTELNSGPGRHGGGFSLDAVAAPDRQAEGFNAPPLVSLSRVCTPFPLALEILAP